jgi:hypothetical protein
VADAGASSSRPGRALLPASRRLRPANGDPPVQGAGRHNSGGLVSPTRHSTNQQPWDQQVAISYLLGLDSRIPQEFQEERVATMINLAISAALATAIMAVFTDRPRLRFSHYLPRNACRLFRC